MRRFHNGDSYPGSIKTAFFQDLKKFPLNNIPACFTENKAGAGCFIFIIQIPQDHNGDIPAPPAIK